MKETRYYKGIYQVEIINYFLFSDSTEIIHGVLVKALEDIPLTSVATIYKGQEFLTITRLLHKSKKET